MFASGDAGRYISGHASDAVLKQSACFAAISGTGHHAGEVFYENIMHRQQPDVGL